MPNLIKGFRSLEGFYVARDAINSMERRVRALVAFYSETGNTEKAARAIAEGLERAGVEAVVKRVESLRPGEIGHFDLVCIGTPVHYAAPASKVREFLERLPELNGKKAAIFCTYGFFGASRTLAILRSILEERKAEVLGELKVAGTVYHFKPLLLRRGRPDAEDLAKCRKFGERLGRALLSGTTP